MEPGGPYDSGAHGRAWMGVRRIRKGGGGGLAIRGQHRHLVLHGSGLHGGGQGANRTLQLKAWMGVARA